MKDNDIPAFPGQQILSPNGTWNQTWEPGMTFREYAAIKLRIPDSGTEWVDVMITKAQRRDLAGLAMQGMFAGDWEEMDAYRIAEEAFKQADAMLRESEKYNEE